MTEPKRPRPKQEVLRDFTKILYKHDLMQVKSPHDDEYEVEALSILARMSEVQVHLAEQEDDALEATHAIVAQTFQFWFDDEIVKQLEFEPVSIELLDMFVKSFPFDEPQPVPIEDQPVHVSTLGVDDEDESLNTD